MADPSNLSSQSSKVSLLCDSKLHFSCFLSGPKELSSPIRMYFSPPAHKCEKPGRFDSSEAKCGRILIRIRKRRLGGLALSAKSKLRKVLLYEPSLLFPLLDFVRPPRNHLEHTSTSVWLGNKCDVQQTLTSVLIQDCNLYGSTFAARGI